MPELQPSERDREMAGEFTQGLTETWDVSDTFRSQVSGIIAQLLAAARAEGQSEAIEACAKIADTHGVHWLAAKIRALMSLGGESDD